MNFKKIIAFIVVAVMLIIPTIAADVKTETLPDIKGSTYEEAVRYAYDRNIITGKEDGKYHGDDNITRAEAAKMLVEAQVLMIKEYTSGRYTDVFTTDWYADYVETAAANKIVNGFGNGKFKPEANITFEQACAMILNCLGYDTTGSNYPVITVTTALELGIGEKVVSRGSVAINRYEFAQMLYNVKDAHTVNEIYAGKPIFSKDESAKDVIGYTYTTYMIDNDIDTFGTIIKHCDKDTIPDVILTTTKNAFLYVSTNNIPFFVTEDKKDNIVWYKDVKDATVYINGEKKSIKDILPDEKVKLVYDENNIVISIVVWRATATTTGSYVFAKNVCGDEFIPNTSVITYYGDNFAKISNTTITGIMCYYTYLPDENIVEVNYIPTNVEVNERPIGTVTLTIDDADTRYDIIVGCLNNSEMILRYDCEGNLFDYEVKLDNKTIFTKYIEKKNVEDAYNAIIKALDEAETLPSTDEEMTTFCVAAANNDRVTINVSVQETEYVITISMGNYIEHYTYVMPV